jgi:hypothetical protein
MNDKLSILVRVDLDCARAQVATKGHVTSQSIKALDTVMKRANALMDGLAMEIDMTRALVEPAALEQLHACSRSHHLPEHIDPFQAECRLSILAPEDGLPLAGAMGRAA